MLTVHHLGHSQSDRIVWLCEELEIPYELKKYDRSPLLSPESYKQLHPIGAAPVIEDGPNIKIAESEACMEYIINIYGGGRLMAKPGAPNYADFLYWYHLVNGTFAPASSRMLALKFAGVAEDNPSFKLFNGKLQQILRFIDDRLATVPWLAGDEFSAADIMVMFSFTVSREFNGTDLSPFPNILAYVRRAVDRPAYKRYLQKGDPDVDISKYINGPPPPPHPATRL